MFEIGSSLREARERRGLTLADAEAETKIRLRYLAALEDERFDVLPGDAYARGFLRTYAEYLDLDGDLYADEFGERFAAPEEPMTLPPAAPRARRAAVGGVFDRRLAFALAAAAAVAGLFWLGSDGTERPSLAPPPPVASRAARRPSPPPAARERRRKRPATLSLVAARGDCWLSVRAGSEQGRTLYEATLAAGKRLRFGLRRPLWIRFGAPSNVDAIVAGKRVALPSLTADVVVTSSGVRLDSSG